MASAKARMDDQEWLTSFEKGEWRSVARVQQEIYRYQKHAADWLERNRVVSLTLPAADFEILRARAKASGTSYQSLLLNLVHRFVHGDLPIEAH